MKTLKTIFSTFSVILFVSITVVSGFGSAQTYPWMEPSKEARPTPEDPTGQKNTPAVAALSDPAYIDLARRMQWLHHDFTTKEQVEDFQLTITNVSWQDAGRGHGSAYGRNISDVRLLSLYREAGEIKQIAQPIIRLDNFEDKTVDINMEEVFVPVGNAWGLEKPFAVTLKDLLEHMSQFLSWREDIKGSLYLERDSEVLVSAQASIMPVPKGGEAHFVPAIYNYQSKPGNPAVLVILVSNRGTSITVVDNKRDTFRSEAFSRVGQMLFHNDNGQKKPFILEGLSKVEATAEGRSRLEELAASGAAIGGQSAVNQVMLIQVPLRYPKSQRVTPYFSASTDASSKGVGTTRGARSIGPADQAGLETGVTDIAGYSLGKFTELDSLGAKLERDPELPIRVDVTYYFSSDVTKFSSEQLRVIPDQLAKVYEAGENLGSLVTSDDYTRITRNHRPEEQTWWPEVVNTCNIPHGWDAVTVFEAHLGEAWVFSFATKELGIKSCQTLGF